MIDLAVLHNAEHRMTEDELGQQAGQFDAQLALLRHKQLHAVPAGAVSAEWCEMCGLAIPALRRQIVPGVTRCVDCQGAIERNGRVYG